MGIARLGRVARVMSATFVLSCTRSGEPCAAPNCGSGYECLANTCTPLGAEPVPKDTMRVVLEPAAVAGSNGEETRAGTLDLGRAFAALYLRFDDAWKRDRAVVRAFLLLEPAAYAEPNGEDLPLHVWTIQGPWTAQRIASGARPNLGSPHARGLLRTSPPGVARIDVTEVVRVLAERSEDYGVAVITGEDRSALVRTGSSGGAPRLELYVRAR